MAGTIVSKAGAGKPGLCDGGGGWVFMPPCRKAGAGGQRCQRVLDLRSNPVWRGLVILRGQAMILPMNLMDRLERRFGRLSFPGFLRYYALFHLMVYSMQIINEDIGSLLDFDREKILAGEVWRMVTFLFASSGNLGVSVLGVVFFFFLMRIMMMISDALEESWGVFKTSMFHYFAICGLLLGNFVMPVAMPFSGFILYGSAFFAFATLFPRVVWHLFLIIPVEVRFIAMFKAVLLLLTILADPRVLPFLILGYGNYLLWVVLPIWRGSQRTTVQKTFKKKLKGGFGDDEEPFHKCVECHRNDVMDPEREFRVGEDGQEYCDLCLEKMESDA